MLEVSNICLVNATALGYEILEGLVLLGIGGFTIADSKVIEEDDLLHTFIFGCSILGSFQSCYLHEALKRIICRYIYMLMRA